MQLYGNMLIGFKYIGELIKNKEATDEIIMKKVPELGGDGGLIAVDRNGNIAMPFNTAGMYRGYINSNGEREIKIYSE